MSDTTIHVTANAEVDGVGFDRPIRSAQVDPEGPVLKYKGDVKL